MKKILCLLLAIFMLVSVCGCFSDKKDDDVRGEIISGDNNKTENDVDKDSDTNTETDTEISNEPEFSLGKTSGDIYNSDFLGLSFNLPSEWQFYTDEQILQLNNLAVDLFDDDIKEQLKNASVIYDMCAAHKTDGSSTNVNLEKLTTAQIYSLDIKSTLEAQISAIKSAFENTGYTEVAVSYQKVTVDGRELDALKTTAKMQGTDFHSVTFSFTKGTYLVSVNAGAYGADKIESILSSYNFK